MKKLFRWKKLKTKTCEVIAQGRATISHQHGVGRDHAPYMAVEKGELGMRVIETLINDFDPEKRLNPGILIQDDQ